MNGDDSKVGPTLDYATPQVGLARPARRPGLLVAGFAAVWFGLFGWLLSLAAQRRPFREEWGKAAVLLGAGLLGVIFVASGARRRVRAHGWSWREAIATAATIVALVLVAAAAWNVAQWRR